jgi:HD-like signal output (HDOD) protein
MITLVPSDQEILRVAEKLPTAPRLLVELGHLMNNPHLEAEDVVALLRQDAPLVAHIIRMANSAAYAPVQQTGSLERALDLVGLAEVHRLVGAVAATQLAEEHLSLYPIDGAKLRLNALFGAVLMEEFAKWSGERPHRCYTVGLLRPIGMMALERLVPAGVGIPPFLASGESELNVWEQKHWGLTNGEVAEKILLAWRLPPETVSAIRHHYHPAGRHNPIIHLLTIAASAAAERCSAIAGEESYWKLTAENFEKAGLRVQDYQTACQKAQRKFAQLKLAII